MTIFWSFERFQYFNFETSFLKNVKLFLLWNKYPEKHKLFSKNRSTAFKLKVPRSTTQHFYKNCCQKPMLRQIEWGVLNQPVTKNGVSPVTTIFFRKFCFCLRTFNNELNWYTKSPYSYFSKALSFIWGCFFPVSILKYYLHFTTIKGVF